PEVFSPSRFIFWLLFMPAFCFFGVPWVEKLCAGLFGSVNPDLAALVVVGSMPMARLGQRNDGALMAVALAALAGVVHIQPAGLVANAFLLLESALILSSLAGISVGRCVLRPILLAVLALRGHLPWRYQDFVAYAMEILVLRQMGEEVGFTHRLLRDHFAHL